MAYQVHDSFEGTLHVQYPRTTNTNSLWMSSFFHRVMYTLTPHWLHDMTCTYSILVTMSYLWGWFRQLIAGNEVFVFVYTHEEQMISQQFKHRMNISQANNYCYLGLDICLLWRIRRCCYCYCIFSLPLSLGNTIFLSLIRYHTITWWYSNTSIWHVG